MTDQENKRYTILICLFLPLVTFLTFWPVFHCGFINYDDPYYVTLNPNVQHGLSMESLRWALTTGHARNWHPLTWVSHMLDVKLYGLNPTGHHLTNLLFHLANTVVIFLALKRLTGTLWRSAFVAALFALHPLHVESVAWIAERKDVLSTFFWALALWTYAGYARYRATQTAPIESTASSHQHLASKIRNQAPLYYALTLLFFALGLLAKPMLVTFPFLLLVLDYWPLRRLQFADHPTQSGTFLKAFLPLVREKIPLFGLSALSCGMTLWAQERALMPLHGLPFGFRLCNAMLSYLRYVWRMIWPAHLSAHYPYPQFWSLWFILSVAVVLASFSVVALRLAKHHPYVIVGWLWFLGTLVPTIGLVQVGLQSMADRYTYVPLIGLFIIASWGGFDLSLHWRVSVKVMSAGATLILAACIGVTRSQVYYWHDSVSLFRHAVAVTRSNPLAYYNLGVGLLDHGDLSGAKKAFQNAAEINPAYAEAWNNLGSVTHRQGNAEASIEFYNQALKYKPGYAVAHYNLGLALAELGKLDDAASHFQTALKLTPSLASVHKDLGHVLSKKMEFTPALSHLNEYVRLQPGDAEGHVLLAEALRQSGAKEQARKQYSTALTLQPDLPERYEQLARGLADTGKMDAAMESYTTALQFRTDDVDIVQRFAQFLATHGKMADALANFTEVLRLRPEDPQAHYDLALATVIEGNAREAIAYYRRALELRPDWPVALNDLAWLLATHPRASLRNGAEAVRLAERACDLSQHQEARYSGTLDAAYAEAGRFEDAIRTASQTRKLAVAAGQTDLVLAAEKRLEYYRAGQPFRQQ